MSDRRSSSASEDWLWFGVEVVAWGLTRWVAHRFGQPPEHPRRDREPPRPIPSVRPRPAPTCTCSDEDLAALHEVMARFEPLGSTCTPEDMEELRELIREREQLARFR